ncbi:MAG: hypothetical protein IJ545_04645 [Alphaproteobacteria bacterium]|nr:hypothetical protein [Alphaproteobacteria bacterium]
MLKAVKDFIIEFGFVGAIFGLLSVFWSREQLSTRDKIKKVFASIALSMIVGSICMGVNLNEYLTFAIIGGCCSFSREIFDTVSGLLKLLADKPLQTIKSLMDILRGERHDKGENT